MPFNLDFSAAVSILIGFVAFISPIITTCISNAHDTKIHKLNLKQQHFEKTVLYKTTIFENYLKSVSLLSKSVDATYLSQYSESFSLAFLYASDPLRSKMNICDEFVAETRYSELNSFIPILTSLVVEQISQL